MSGYNSSMQYTIGTAIERARENNYVVELLLEGHWVSGHVVASDGQGVVLESTGEEHVIVRLERISAVRVRAGSPFRKLTGVPTPRSASQSEAPRTPDGAVPMPGPQREAPEVPQTV